MNDGNYTRFAFANITRGLKMYCSNNFVSSKFNDILKEISCKVIKYKWRYEHSGADLIFLVDFLSSHNQLDEILFRETLLSHRPFFDKNDVFVPF